MSDEPQWMRDLHIAKARSLEEAGCTAVWALWAISQLPTKLRRAAAKAWKQGKLPVDLRDGLEAVTR